MFSKYLLTAVLKEIEITEFNFFFRRISLIIIASKRKIFYIYSILYNLKRMNCKVKCISSNSKLYVFTYIVYN